MGAFEPEPAFTELDEVVYHLLCAKKLLDERSDSMLRSLIDMAILHIHETASSVDFS